MRFLIDPLLADKGAYSGFEGSANSELRNPLVSLPMPLQRIVDVDAVIVTHLHSDHWDDAAKTGLRKSMVIFAQNDEDAAQIKQQGFTDVRVLTETTEFNGVRLAKTAGQHGTDEALKAMPSLGHVCGIAFSHPSANTLYVAGDTIWNRHVEEAIARHRPGVIVLNAGKAVMTGFAPIIMGEADVLAVHKAAPKATLVASHYGGYQPLHPQPCGPARIFGARRLRIKPPDPGRWRELEYLNKSACPMSVYGSYRASVNDVEMGAAIRIIVMPAHDRCWREAEDTFDPKRSSAP